jgi:hypothetical protein
VNIPLMRQNEVMNGVAVYDREGNKACTSKLAARTGISQVNISRWTAESLTCFAQNYPIVLLNTDSSYIFSKNMLRVSKKSQHIQSAIRNNTGITCIGIMHKSL